MTFLIRSLFLFVLLFSTPGGAETRYVTDEFEVTLRSGTSTSNSIITMLKSGQAVNVIEEDVATKYTLVETSGGKQGYILTRFLKNQPSGRDRVAQLQKINEQLQQTIAELSTERDEYKQYKEADSSSIEQLKTRLSLTENELSQLKENTRDTVRVIKQNDTLKTRIDDLEAEKLLLSEENAHYKDSTAMDWFIRGAGVSLGAFLLGIIITRIRWKKRDSWGSY